MAPRAPPALTVSPCALSGNQAQASSVGEGARPLPALPPGAVLCPQENRSLRLQRSVAWSLACSSGRQSLAWHNLRRNWGTRWHPRALSTDHGRVGSLRAPCVRPHCEKCGVWQLLQLRGPLALHACPSLGQGKDPTS